MSRALQALLVVAQNRRLGPKELQAWRCCRAWYGANIYGRERLGDRTFSASWQWIEEFWPSHDVLRGINPDATGDELMEFRISLPACLPSRPITDAWSLLCAALAAADEYENFFQLQDVVSMRSEQYNKAYLLVSIGDVEFEFDMAAECLEGPCFRQNPNRETWYIDVYGPDTISLYLELQEHGMGCLKLTEHEESGQHRSTTVCWLPNLCLAVIRDRLVALWQGMREA
jgi:hypothetical protein